MRASTQLARHVTAVRRIGSVPSRFFPVRRDPTNGDCFDDPCDAPCPPRPPRKLGSSAIRRWNVANQAKSDAGTVSDVAVTGGCHPGHCASGEQPRQGGVFVLVGGAVFKTVERQPLSLVGSIPIRLRYLRFHSVRRPPAVVV
jgi:hypothetical protein